MLSYWFLKKLILVFLKKLSPIFYYGFIMIVFPKMYIHDENNLKTLEVG